MVQQALEKLQFLKNNFNQLQILQNKFVQQEQNLNMTQSTSQDHHPSLDYVGKGSVSSKPGQIQSNNRLDSNSSRSKNEDSRQGLYVQENMYNPNEKNTSRTEQTNLQKLMADAERITASVRKRGKGSETKMLGDDNPLIRDDVGTPDYTSGFQKHSNTSKRVQIIDPLDKRSPIVLSRASKQRQ